MAKVVRPRQLPRRAARFGRIGAAHHNHKYTPCRPHLLLIIAIPRGSPVRPAPAEANKRLARASFSLGRPVATPRLGATRIPLRPCVAVPYTPRKTTRFGSGVSQQPLVEAAVSAALPRSVSVAARKLHACSGRRQGAKAGAAYVGWAVARPATGQVRPIRPAPQACSGCPSPRRVVSLAAA